MSFSQSNFFEIISKISLYPFLFFIILSYQRIGINIYFGGMLVELVEIHGSPSVRLIPVKRRLGGCCFASPGFHRNPRLFDQWWASGSFFLLSAVVWKTKAPSYSHMLTFASLLSIYYINAFVFNFFQFPEF